jgi:hypothetical protein
LKTFPAARPPLFDVRDRIRRDQNLFFPKIVEQERLKRCAILERLILVSRFNPVHGEIAVDEADAVVDDLATLGKILTANALVNSAAAA